MTVRILQGHVIDVLATLPEKSISACVTSPPFFQLRAYGTEPQVWANGGTPPCADGAHEWADASWRDSRKNDDTAGTKQRTAPGGVGWRNDVKQQAVCVRCNSWRGELGQEPTPEAFVSHLVDVFRAVRRVLRDDGVAFVNLGDSYWSDPGGQNGTTGNVSARAITANTQAGRQDRTSQKHARLKPGDLVGIPWAFAFAMQSSGWVLRSAVTWIKTSPMPESIGGTAWVKCRVKLTAEASGSYERMCAAGLDARQAMHHARIISAEEFVTRPLGRSVDTVWVDCPGCAACQDNEGLVLRRGSGRPTSATEMLFQFTKNMGRYWYDLEATRVYDSPSREHHYPFGRKDPSVAVGTRGKLVGNMAPGVTWEPDAAGGRNAWNWMTFGGKGAQLKEEHYAAYPPQLPEFCIKAGTSERGVCPTCGAPFARVVSRRTEQKVETTATTKMAEIAKLRANARQFSGGLPETDTTTLGWRPTCAHRGLEPVPAVVLDCFGGSGTTGLVADRLGRDAVLVELKPDYAQMAKRRLIGDAPLFADVTLEGAAG